MPKPWLIASCVLLALASFLAGQQNPAEELTDSERIARLEERLAELERALLAHTGDSSIPVSALDLEPRLMRIEQRLDRIDQREARNSGVAGASSTRMIDSRLRALESAVMRLQR